MESRECRERPVPNTLPDSTSCLALSSSVAGRERAPPREPQGRGQGPEDEDGQRHLLPRQKQQRSDGIITSELIRQQRDPGVFLKLQKALK